MVVKSIWESGVLVCRDNCDSTKGRKGSEMTMVSSMIKSGAEKVSIDPIGRIHPKND